MRAKGVLDAFGCTDERPADCEALHGCQRTSASAVEMHAMHQADVVRSRRGTQRGYTAPLSWFLERAQPPALTKAVCAPSGSQVEFAPKDRGVVGQLAPPTRQT